jgi:glycosyltransferase involved in cell wall biosynthesis
VSQYTIFLDLASVTQYSGRAERAVIDDRLARVACGTLALSAVIITQNESENIAGALESVAWIDDVVVVDSGSSDDTLAIARNYTDRVTTHAWEGYGSQKNHATGLAAHDWVLSLDADERVSPELAREIQEVMSTGPSMQGYRIPRTTRYLGRWIRSTDWYPDHQLRFYDRRVASWNTRYVHESVSIKGRVGRLRSEIRHFAYRDLSHHLSTIDRYTTLAVKQMLADRQSANWLDLVGHPPLVFLRNYLLRRGFCDGLPGLIISLMNSYYVFLKFAKLWEQQRANGAPT